MKVPPPIAKCINRLGKLKPFGLEASRPSLWSGSGREPDAILSDQTGRCWIIVIWLGTGIDAELWQQETVPEFAQVVRNILAWKDSRGKLEQTASQAPAIVLLAPLLKGRLAPLARSEVVVLGEKSCSSAELLANGIMAVPSPRLSPFEKGYWRSQAVPEVLIASPAASIRSPKVNDPHSIPPALLDYQQERCARLDLDPEIEPLAEDFGLRVVTGVAGCGKTLILLHRAALIARHFPKAKVLLLTHNRPLINEISHRLKRSQLEGRIECRTFHQWLRSFNPPQGTKIKDFERRRWLEIQKQTHPNLARFTEAWLADELTWMFDHNLVDEAYLTAERRGRGQGLTASQRLSLLKILQAYRQYLRQSGFFDWAELPLLAQKPLKRNGSELSYQFLLLDEVQFFAPTWMELLRSVIAPGGHLFLCADPTQGFLKRRMAWSSMNLAVIGKTHKLERPYRCSKAILTFAKEFYLRRVALDEQEPLNLPSPEWLETIEAGEPPVIERCATPQEQRRRTEVMIRNLLKQGVSKDQILLLIAGRNMNVDDFVHGLNHALGPGTAIPCKEAVGEAIGVAHLMAATGLERAVVFLLGLDDLIAEEKNPLLTRDEALEVRLQHTRQIYMGLTRAMDRLVVFTSREELLTDLGQGSD